MTAPAVHDRFVLDRRYPHSPAKVFAAFATEEARRRWFAPPSDDWEIVERSFDFSVGGIETIEANWKTGKISRMDAVYHDIVADRRIVYSYRMKLDGVPISVSMTSVELAPDGDGTRLTLTEHGIYLDGYEDKGSREHGVGWQMDKLGETLTD